MMKFGRAGNCDFVPGGFLFRALISKADNCFAKWHCRLLAASLRVKSMERIAALDLKLLLPKMMRFS
jgi:hypothetical protein